MSEETQLTRYQQAVMSEIVAAVGDPAATLESIADHLNTVYADAQERGDQRSMEIIASSWNYVEQFATVQGHTLNLAAAARELAEIATAQRDNLQEQMDDIRVALDEVDENHPDLADYASAIRDDAEEYVQEMMYDSLLEHAFETIDEEVNGMLMELAKALGIANLGWNAVNHLSDKLRGGDHFTDQQKALFRQIIEIEIAEQERRDAEREAQMQEWKRKAAEEYAKLNEEHAKRNAGGAATA